MWIYWLLALAAALVFAGGIAFGGIYTLILVPIAVIGAIVAVVYTVFAGAAQRRAGTQTDPSATARGSATRTRQTSPPRSPTSPEELVDARRGQQ
jgi:mannose/fructose/N-acetylgalactosamine-specific phosphotransferase system component IIC